MNFGYNFYNQVSDMKIYKIFLNKWLQDYLIFKIGKVLFKLKFIKKVYV